MRSPFQAGTIEGDNVRGVLPLGQVTGIIEDTPTVEELISRIMTEAREVLGKLPS